MKKNDERIVGLNKGGEEREDIEALFFFVGFSHENGNCTFLPNFLVFVRIFGSPLGIRSFAP